MDQVIIPAHIYEEMLAHCREGYPNEACGLLAGTGNLVSRIYKITNTENSPAVYKMDSKEQFRVMKELRENGLSMLAIFHSHPDAPAYPSQTDVRFAFYDDAVYVIVSLIENMPVARAFLITDGKIGEIKIEIT